MAISTFTDLKTAVQRITSRYDLTADMDNVVQLAEARLNRALGPVEQDNTIAATIGQRTINVSTLKVVRPVELYRTDGTEEVEVVAQGAGSFPFTTDRGAPRIWSFSADTITFDRPADIAYSFRFRAVARFALSASATTNWLLTNHPDVYVSACIAWTDLYSEAIPEFQIHKRELLSAIQAVRGEIAAMKPSDVVLDPMFSITARKHHGLR
jgi:hypothetical protein